MKPSFPSSLRRAVQQEIWILQLMARFIGYPLAAFGWLTFFICLYSLPELTDGAKAFEVCGYFIVPGWLLLRFAAGLFPFGRCLFRWMRQDEGTVDPAPEGD